MPSEESERYHRASARLGTTIRDKYRLDRVLGLGGMAAVYAATHRNRKQFAVKMLHPELSIRQDVRTRFLREGYAANSFKHPGAVAVLDDDVADDGAAFLVMELLEGDELENLAINNGGRLPVQAVLAIGYQLLDVLAAAHDKGIVHRDIKPPNLFLTDDGTIKVLDFGIARVRDALADEARGTAAGTLLGTPGFMPPEQALGKSDEIDGQSDVWAAGATLFSLLTGQATHAGDNAAQLMVAAATQPARKLQSIAPHVPDAVAQIIDCALAFEKSSRWPSAAAMRDAIAETYAVTCSEPVSRAPLVRLIQGLKPRLVPPSPQGTAPVDRSAATMDAVKGATGGAASAPAGGGRSAAVPTIGGQTSVATFLLPGVAGRKRTERMVLGGAAVLVLGFVAFALRGSSSGSVDAATGKGGPSRVNAGITPVGVVIPSSDPASPSAVITSWSPVAATSASSGPSAPASRSRSTTPSSGDPPPALTRPPLRPLSPPSQPAISQPAEATASPSKRPPSTPCKLVETLDKAGESHFACPCAKCE
jgi:serine/threonine-protein kinase